MLGRTAVLLTVMGVLTVVSAQTAKQRRLASLDERIAARTDPQQAYERVVMRAGLSHGAVDSFGGRTHSDLFMPSEVFQMLMNFAYLPSESRSESYRRAKADVVVQHGLPPDFWERLEVVAASHIADARLVREIGATVPKLHGAERERVMEDLAIRQRDSCRSRADALAAARSEFGAERFDRFLYDAVAVNMFHATDQLPSPENLLWRERGCR